MRVSGVRIGDITKVDLSEGRAIVTMDVDPEYKDLVHTDATALLRPKTGLKDMFIELNPGTKSAPVAKRGLHDPGQEHAARRQPRRDLLAARRRHARLPAAADQRRRRGPAKPRRRSAGGLPPLRADAQRPRAASTSTSPLRHRNLRRLIHSSTCSTARWPRKGAELAQLVETSSAVFRALRLRGQEHHARRSATCPGTLQQTTQTLGKVQTLRRRARARPSRSCARPSAALDSRQPRGHAVRQGGRADPAHQIRPFVRDARPVVRDLKPASKNLADGDARPDAHVHGPQPPLQHGRLQPERQARARTSPTATRASCSGSPGWTTTARALFSTSDANGPFRPVTLGAPCSTLKQTGDAEPAAGDDPRPGAHRPPRLWRGER